MSEFEEEFEVSIRLRNNRIKQCRLQLGLSTREMAEKAGMSYGKYLEYENLKSSPLGKGHGNASDPGLVVWRPSALRLAATLGHPPEYLWPDAVLAVRKPEVLAKARAEQVLALAKMAADVPSLPSPEDVATDLEAYRAIDDVISTLDETSARIIRMRYGFDGGPGMTVQEVADELGLDYARVRQAELSALREFRHPKWRKVLESAASDEAEKLRFRLISSEVFNHHMCHVPGCPDDVDATLGWLCHRHLKMVPADVMDEVMAKKRRRGRAFEEAMRSAVARVRDITVPYTRS